MGGGCASPSITQPRGLSTQLQIDDVNEAPRRHLLLCIPNFPDIQQHLPEHTHSLTSLTVNYHLARSRGDPSTRASLPFLPRNTNTHMPIIDESLICRFRKSPSHFLPLSRWLLYHQDEDYKQRSVVIPKYQPNAYETFTINKIKSNIILGSKRQKTFNFLCSSCLASPANCLKPPDKNPTPR